MSGFTRPSNYNGGGAGHYITTATNRLTAEASQLPSARLKNSWHLVSSRRFQPCLKVLVCPAPKAQRKKKLISTSAPDVCNQRPRDVDQRSASLGFGSVEKNSRIRPNPNPVKKPSIRPNPNPNPGFGASLLSDLHQRAVDKSLQSENGHLDLFLRFLLGLSLESNQKLQQDLLKHKEKISWSKEKTVEYIKTRIKLNPDKSINLFHSLNELGDQSLVNEVQEYVQSGNLSNKKITSSQWSAVVFILLTSEHLDVFELRKYTGDMTSDEVLQKLLPVVEASRSADLSMCELSEKSISGLTSVLTSKSSCLRDLDLYENYNLRDSEVKLLSDGLKNPNCKLEKLRLRCCDVTDDGCAALASALRSNTHLRDLDLSENYNLSDSAVKLLSDGLKNPNCKLEKLRLWGCGVTDEGCAALASALRSNTHLRDLDLSENRQLRDSGVKRLCDVLKNPNCKLETLGLSDCDVTDEGFAALASALISNSHLRHLDLSENKQIRGSGVKLISDGLKNSNCKLEKLKLYQCDVTDEGCAALASALRSNSHLRDLDLSNNDLRDSGVKRLSDGLKNPNCKLEKLRLYRCDVTDEGCAALASALKSNPSHLRELNLSNNKLSDSGKKLLSDLKEDSHYKLDTLEFW
ncbi:ribonuclease inhibitor-like isoform X2 [Paramisgurnus dabryanus]|uniref:ribonuclease inhibitor-like isoform X2 n=1 Tax=Paramisgurnus dabryanus TaxID=90735 RepID=UPI003CCFC73C